jgi:hypothetical protein
MIVIEKPVCWSYDCDDECLRFDCKTVSALYSGCYCKDGYDRNYEVKDEEPTTCDCCKICKYTRGYILDWYFSRERWLQFWGVSYNDGDKIDTCYSCSKQLYYVYSCDGVVYRCVSNKELHRIVPGLITEKEKDTLETECLAFVSRMF